LHVTGGFGAKKKKTKKVGEVWTEERKSGQSPKNVGPKMESVGEVSATQSLDGGDDIGGKLVNRK